MLKSMTACARAVTTSGHISVETEIRSGNSRNLDLSIRLTSGLNQLETTIKERVAQQFKRGRIEVRIRVDDQSEEATLCNVDLPRAKAYHSALCSLKEQLNLQPEITFADILSAGGIIKPSESVMEPGFYWEPVKQCLEDALGQLDAMRSAEGAYIREDFSKRLCFIETSIEAIKNQTGDMLTHCQTRLKERIQLLTKGMVDIDPERISQEAAFLADRSDITEELVRAESHVKQFRLLMEEDEAPGRKLNFLLQEFNREFNTMGSKSGNTSVSHIIVEVKSELEKLREQVQNIE